jgi:uncharacterized protein YuzE
VKEIEDNAMVERDDDGEAMGIEVLGAKKEGAPPTFDQCRFTPILRNQSSLDRQPVRHLWLDV